jgi:hypothetical protein
MRISKDWKYHLTHSFMDECRSFKRTPADWLFIASLTVAALSWLFSMPVVTYLAGSLSVVLAACLAARDFGNYLIWRDQPLTAKALNELAVYTASANFTSHPELGFNPPVQQMTNNDLATWCRRYNNIIDVDPGEAEAEDRAELVQYLRDRLTGTIPPRPSRLVKDAWYLPKRYEIAKGNKDGWYYDTA